MRKNKGRIGKGRAEESKTVKDDRDFLREKREREVFNPRSFHISQTGQANIPGISKS